MTNQQRRTEADDNWLTKRSDTFATIRRWFRPVLGDTVGDAVSRSEAAGLLLGPPRNPSLKVRDGHTEQVRYAEQQYAYTTVQIDMGLCRRCGDLLKERQRLVFVEHDGSRSSIGAVRMCRACDADGWMFQSHMPSVVAARKRHQPPVV